MKTWLLIISILLLSCTKDIVQPAEPELNHDTFGLDLQETHRDIDFVAFAAPTEILYEQSITIILLDFDGGIVPKGSAWALNDSIVYEDAGMTIAEQKHVFDSVSHDFAPFHNIVVTTDEGAYFRAHPRKRTRLILTQTFSFYGSTAGGVAYTGSIKWQNDTPCFVFTSLLRFNRKHIQEAASHEIGHTLSLRHHADWLDCVLKSNYYMGTPEVGSIMGVGYNSKRVEWQDGLTPYNCTDIQYAKKIIQEITR